VERRRRWLNPLILGNFVTALKCPYLRDDWLSDICTLEILTRTKPKNTPLSYVHPITGHFVYTPVRKYRSKNVHRCTIYIYICVCLSIWIHKSNRDSLCRGYRTLHVEVIPCLYSSQAKKFAMKWARSWNGRNKKCVQNFHGESSSKMLTWDAETHTWMSYV